MCEDFEVRISCKKCRAFFILKESELNEMGDSNPCPHCREELLAEEVN